MIVSSFDGMVTLDSYSSTGFTITVPDYPEQWTVTFHPGSDPDCNGITSFGGSVLSINAEKPEIDDCPHKLVIGKSHSFNLTATLNYPYNGFSDPDEVKGYEWEFLSGGSGWSISTIDDGGVEDKIAQLVTDNQNNATIRVRGISDCSNLKSDWQTCEIVRFVQPPCPIVGAPSFVLCGSTDAIGLLATQTAGLTGYTFHWTYPSGWSGPATGPAVSVTPNGTNAGTISVEAHAFSQTSDACNVTIGFEPIEPSTQALGPAFLCETSLYKLDIDPPAGASVAWAVSPTTATTSSSGTGSSVYLTPSSTYHGNATLTFTITTACGVVTRNITFFAGKPKFDSVSIDGMIPSSSSYNYICPTIQGSHYVIVTFSGDSDNCVDDWNDFGTTYTSSENCHEFDFTLQYNPLNNPPYNCVYLNIDISNECGTTSKTLIMCPSNNACRRDRSAYKLSITPNPAITEISVQLVLTDEEGRLTQIPLSNFEIIDSKGNLYKSYKVSDRTAQIDVSNMRNGLYYIRTVIEDNYIMEEFIIEH
ncbi:MAG TPA: T9SS type A sorting domain-containing protein [Saprospiraceae bacterium]|nr:T9SS type A sorting domain-containing protein [Saprospiraceae bacterium]